MSKIFLILCLVGCLLIAGCISSEVKSTTSKNTIHPSAISKEVYQVKYFTVKDCGLCEKTDVLLVNLSAKYPGKFAVIHYDLTNNQTNREIFLHYTKDIKIKSVPFIVINERNIFQNYTDIVNNLEPSIAGQKRLI